MYADAELNYLEVKFVRQIGILNIILLKKRKLFKHFCWYS